jgi:hypothetical protein
MSPCCTKNKSTPSTLHFLVGLTDRHLTPKSCPSRPYLHFQRDQRLGPQREHGRVQASVPVWFGRRDIVFDRPRDRCPHLVDEPQDVVAQLLVGEGRPGGSEAG